MTRVSTRAYTQITALVLQILQDTGAATYGPTETDYWIAECLKEFSVYDSRIVRVTFDIEARTGKATSGTTTKTLEDTTNDHFVATDDDFEKVVYNTTDKTWAVITSFTDTDEVGLSNDIMVSGEGYKIFNKKCINNKQVYIGDVGSYLWIEGVEYKCQQLPRSFRNWKLYGDVLEIDIDFTPTDGDEVNVYFAKPHYLQRMLDLEGTVYHSTPGSNYPAGSVAIVTNDFTDGETCYKGNEFYITGHRNPYTCTEQIGWGQQAGAGSVLYFTPPLEAAATDDDVVTFIRSSLKPQHEELFCHLVAARALISEANAQLIQAKADLTTGRALVNTVNLGGTGAAVANAYISYARAGEELAREQRTMGERKLGEVIGKMETLSPPRTKRTYARD